MTRLHAPISVRLNAAAVHVCGMHLSVCLIFNWPFAIQVLVFQIFFPALRGPLIAMASYLISIPRYQIYLLPVHDAVGLSPGQIKL